MKATFYGTLVLLVQPLVGCTMLFAQEQAGRDRRHQLPIGLQVQTRVRNSALGSHESGDHDHHDSRHNANGQDA